MDAKMQAQNIQYFPSCGPNNGPMQGGPMPPHMSHMDNSMSQEGVMGPMGMGNPMGNGAGPMGPMGGNMGMPAGMVPIMRGPMRPPMGMRMPQMMFVTGPKGSPMGMGAPDASQPLPPSMGQNNSFKNSPFVGPTTADPNYAQQFHNFQQQLYATSTRSQMGGQAMGPGPGPRICSSRHTSTLNSIYGAECVYQIVEFESTLRVNKAERMMRIPSTNQRAESALSDAYIAKSKLLHFQTNV
ncbi:hypothetical protein NQ317_009954 [Molorchus minor]|uniref:Uncharacterized protein n=1 Tax=Molorchus minor TaxID=1323400 RepID=A0ABQ9K6Z4_9CUCU|nr:hypothetical protein NQ317_009954 [Molorchus minor]